MYQKTLVPLDGSKQAEAAFLLASQLARMSNAEVTLLQVVEYPLELYSRCPANTFADRSQPDEQLLAAKEAFCSETEEYLKHFASIVAMNGSNVSIEIQECPVVEAILNTVQKFKTDLIVMVTIGQDRNPWMMGAVTNRILREAPVPVILIRNESWITVPDRIGKPDGVGQKEAWIRPNSLPYP
jgi:nucleotide-binding universal stress UspA family protein